MIEEEARCWITDRFGSRGSAALSRLVDLVLDEAKRQNLIAPSTIETIWTRHIVDSAQLIALANPAGTWLDIGTGAGFPGLVVAILTQRPVILVEPRRHRAAFLRRVIAAMNLEARVTVEEAKIEKVAVAVVAVISARAVAPLTTIFANAVHCAKPATQWLLPKGRSGYDEIMAARASWNGEFHVEHSMTDATSSIVVATAVSRR